MHSYVSMKYYIMIVKMEQNIFLLNVFSNTKAWG